MKRRRLKRSVKVLILFILILLLVIGFFEFSNKANNNMNKKNKINIVDIVYKKLDLYDIDRKFLKWVNEKYPTALSELHKKLKKEKYNLGMWHEVTGNSYIVLNDLYNDRYKDADNVSIINNNKASAEISFVGDVSLADNWFIAPRYDEGGIDRILSINMQNIMKNSDVMIANSEFTVSSRGSALVNKMYTFKASKERLSIYDEMGVDMVTLANNHVYDYGLDAFLDMLDAFNEYNIPHIGAGHNFEEASKPYYFIINGYKFAFISATRAEKNVMTPEATVDSAGVFWCYDPTNVINLIKDLRNKVDYIIPIIHFGKENSHELEEEQISSAHSYIDAGADVVVGHHAHTLQGIELYNNKPIIYNLGNFLFNNEKIDTALFKVVLNNNGILEYYIIPALQKNSSTDVLEGEEKNRVINDINSYSINVNIDESGKINSI